MPRRFQRDASLTKSQLAYAVGQKQRMEAAERVTAARNHWRNVIQESVTAAAALRSVRNKGVLKVRWAGVGLGYGVRGPSAVVPGCRCLSEACCALSPCCLCCAYTGTE